MEVFLSGSRSRGSVQGAAASNPAGGQGPSITPDRRKVSRRKQQEPMRRESSNPAAVNRKKQRTLAPSGTSKSLPFEEASAITGKPTSIVVGGSAAVSAPHTPGTPLPRSGVVVGPSPMAAGTAAAAAAAAAATTTTTAATAAAVPATPTAAAAASAARSRPRTPRATSSPPRPGALHKATAAGTQSVADLFATAQQQRLKPPTPTRPVHAPSSAAVPPAAATGAAAPATPASSGVFGSSPMSAGRAPSIPGAGAGAGAAGATAAAEIPKLQQTIAELRAALSLARTAEGKARAEAASVKDDEARHKQAAAVALEKSMRAVINKDLVATRKQLADKEFRLGRIILQRVGHSVMEVWEDGLCFRQLAQEVQEADAAVKQLDAVKKELSKKLRAARSACSGAGAAAAGANTGAGAGVGAGAAAGVAGAAAGPAGGVVAAAAAAGGAASSASAEPVITLSAEDAERLELPTQVSVADLTAAEFIASSQLQEAKRLEGELVKKKKALEMEKATTIREIKRVRDEDRSPYAHRPVLNNRYLLMNLLGAGGFAEVWRGVDLLTAQHVAVKIHRLLDQWSEQRKNSYITHAAREYEIHHKLRHPNVVRLLDVFEIDKNAFATVMELCSGSDLDQRLKEDGALSEREARAILLQVFSALCYLNNCGSWARGQPPHKAVIHYDLKPANVLFDGHLRVKVTDFGLSKIMPDGGAGAGALTSMELTSQGAGTYWYLPPEVFHVGPTPTRIKNNVDVWSLGVLFYEMLYGKKPFGDSMSQDQLVKDRIILDAKEVQFPDGKVSGGARKFIRRCLTYDATSRPTVEELATDRYLTAAKFSPKM